MALMLVGFLLLIASTVVGMLRYLRHGDGDSPAPWLFVAALVCIYNGATMHESQVRADRQENCQSVVDL